MPRPQTAIAPRITGPAAAAPLQVGYEAKALDTAIGKLKAKVETNLRLCEALTPRVEAALAALENFTVVAGTEVEHAGQITVLYDRMTKAALNLVKALDEMSRLRSFVAGGPDTRPDLSSASEVELRAMLLVGIKALGITSLDQLTEKS